MTKKLKISTTEGDIIISLYDETPLHRDNFIKLAQEGFYNNTLFHRVINNFIIQGGDPDSKSASQGKRLGSGGPGYTIKSEFCPTIRFHKRGALSAARLGNEVNPDKESSGSQFYIVWGKTYNISELKQLERQMKMQHEQHLLNLAIASHRKEMLELRKAHNHEGLQKLQDKLKTEIKEQIMENGSPTFTPKQVEAYTTIGGTPFLDGEYTVFGEVEKGLNVVERIQNCETNNMDRPINDINMHIEIIN